MKVAPKIFDPLSFLPAPLLEERCAVSKKLLADKITKAKGDTSLINSYVRHSSVLSLRPEALGCQAFVNEDYHYCELLIGTLELSENTPKPKRQRLQELYHKAVPYPLLLIMQEEAASSSTAYFSAVHLRTHRGHRDAYVWASDKLSTISLSPSPKAEDFLASIAPAGIRCQHLYELYEHWLHALHSIQLCQLPTAEALGGDWDIPFRLSPHSPTHYHYMHSRLEELSHINNKLQTERQINKRVSLGDAAYKLKDELKGYIASNL